MMKSKAGLVSNEMADAVQIDSALTVNGVNPAGATEIANDDLFDPERLRLSQNFADDLGVKVILTVPVQKPKKQTFFRVNSSEQYRITVLLLELKDEREVYLVDPGLGSVLAAETVAAQLFLCIDRSGNLFWWAVKLPGPDGRTNEWVSSARRIAQLAMTRWVRMQSNISSGCYEALVAPGEFPEPQWPEVKLQELLEAAFRDRFIRDLAHPVLKKLRGEI
jgi:hypothetical protein